MDPMTIAGIVSLLTTIGSALGGYIKDKGDARDLQNNPSYNVPTMTKAQQQLADMMGKIGGEQAGGMYSDIMGDELRDFGDIENKANQDFYEQDVPKLAQQFANMGEGNLRGSSYPMALQQQRRNFEEGLSQQRKEYGAGRLGQQQNFMSLLSGQGMQKQFDPIYKPPTPNALYGILGELAKAVPYGMQRYQDNRQSKLPKV